MSPSGRLLKLLNRANSLDPEQGKGSSGGEQDSDLPKFRQTVREAASNSIVLLKNSGLLPLKPQRLRKLAILGPNAQKTTTGGTGSAAVNLYYITNPCDSISKAAKAANAEIDMSLSKGILTNLQPSLPGDAQNSRWEKDWRSGRFSRWTRILGAGGWYVPLEQLGYFHDERRRYLQVSARAAALLSGYWFLDADDDWGLSIQPFEHGKGKALHRRRTSHR